MSEVILNKDNFVQETTNSDLPVLVDFYAPWCGPCRMLAPLVSELADKYHKRLKVCKFNVDDGPEIAESLNISTIPTLVIFKDGKRVAQRIGGANSKILEMFVDDNL